MQTYAFGFPRLGKNREFKKIIESFWKGEIGEKDLITSLDDLEKERISIYQNFVDVFPLAEFTYYDNIFDTALIFGIYKFKNFNDYFEYARGKKSLELKKYFNTNYHYLVPHLKKGIKFSLSWNKPLHYLNKFSSLKSKPIFLIGPYTFLKLSNLEDDFEKTFSLLTQSYSELFSLLFKKGASFIHLEEPFFCVDLDKKEVNLIVKFYKEILNTPLKINLITYYESIDFLKCLYDLNFYGIGLDFVKGEDNLRTIKKIGFPKDKKLIAEIVSGRNIQRSDIFSKVKLLEEIKKIVKLKEEDIYIAPSCPLFHLPYSLENETNIKESLKNKMSFAKERLHELNLIKRVFLKDTKEAKKWAKSVKEEKIKIVRPKFSTLSLPTKEFLKRKKIQKEYLNLPLFPTTTIGSFPQDKELRRTRLLFKKKKNPLKEYDDFIKNRIMHLVKKEEEIGLDVFVHGEFERTDMVEFFAQNLKGFLTTQNGWVISYGTRVYRPPIIYDKVERKKPFTSKEINFAQKLTRKPLKGIITGPITILAWSYNLTKAPLYKICFDLASSLNKEAKDLVEKGIKIIQIDEPAIKEFSPLKRKDRDFYFRWAVRSFNLVSSKLPSFVQIHTHMCYSQFEDIIQWIMKMNFDVITIETAREKGKVLESFKKVKFNRGIGPGVWDIHSRYPAKEKTIREILEKSIEIFGKENVWLNPDCGLKTRNWQEVEVSLKRMVKIAKIYRKKYGS